MTIELAYLDASAAVKLVRPERETAALISLLTTAAAQVSSEVLEVELRCAARRLGDHGLLTRVERLLAQINLLPCTGAVRSRAGEAFDPPQRALDAIHLATALSVDEAGLVLVSYDRSQSHAGEAAGLKALAPA